MRGMQPWPSSLAATGLRLIETMRDSPACTGEFLPEQPALLFCVKACVGRTFLSDFRLSRVLGLVGSESRMCADLQISRAQSDSPSESGCSLELHEGVTLFGTSKLLLFPVSCADHAQQ